MQTFIGLRALFGIAMGGEWVTLLSERFTHALSPRSLAISRVSVRVWRWKRFPLNLEVSFPEFTKKVQSKETGEECPCIDLCELLDFNNGTGTL